jgi:Ca2+:H+ antiporter
MAAHAPGNPLWSILAPCVASVAAGVWATGLAANGGALVDGGFFILLCGAIFAAVHHAEMIAAKVGEPFGSIILAVAVTIIEVGLILTLMLSAPGTSGNSIARDTVYAAVMLVLTGIVGSCLLLGSGKHYEQAIRIRGTSSTLAVLATLSIITLVLPNYTQAVVGPVYSMMQLAVVAAISLVLYVSFLFVQTVRHRDYFLVKNDRGEIVESAHAVPSKGVTAGSAVLLILALVAVVVLAKALSVPLKHMIENANLPYSFASVIVAALVLLPESIAAARAALNNHLQTSINLALGSALASIGLTIPAVAVVGALGHFELHLGVSPAQTVMLVLALFISALTLGNSRTNVMLGIVHLSLFALFMLLSAVP